MLSGSILTFPVIMHY